MDLFTPLKLGALQMRNRIVMAPMTRSRAGVDGMPTDIMVDYYRQRASAGLIISEGIAPSADGLGYCRTPGIYNRAQIDAWRAHHPCSARCGRLHGRADHACGQGGQCPE